MFESLPPETVALKILVADLHDGLEGRVARLRLLMGLEFDFGAGQGLLLPGGTPAQAAYLETRQAFVVGNFLSVILLSQCLLENVLAAHLGIEATSAEIHGRTALPQKPRPGFRETVAGCKGAGLLSDEEERNLLRLADLRNSLAHFRSVDDPSHLDRRMINERRAALAICEDDARFAIGVFVRVLAKPAFRFKLNPPDPFAAGNR
jgi:hypothetical protein